MSSIGQREFLTQRRAVAFFQDALGYAYLGHWKDRDGNSNVEADLLTAWLKRQGYTDKVIRKALFERTFRTVNTFLPLADFYKDASEQETREVLNHGLFTPEDADALAVGANQWFRKRCAMLRDSGVLDEYSAQQVAEHSAGYEVAITLENGRIIFAAERRGAKKLLQFLNEELFRGPITQTLYETNSKREAD